jgi:hypothetical protein
MSHDANPARTGSERVLKNLTLTTTMHLYVILRTHVCHTPLRVYIEHSANALYVIRRALYASLTHKCQTHAICTSAYACMLDECS